MEQDIIDSSKYKISVYSLDSRFADSRTTTNSEFRVTNPNPIRNLIRLRLASVEIPLVEHIFSADKGNLTFVVGIRSFVSPYDYVNYTCGPLAEGNYTSSTICAAVQTLLVGIRAGFTCAADPISGFVRINNPGLDFIIDFNSPVPEIARRSTHWGLGYYLGFRVRQITGSSTSTSTIIVTPNPYYLIQLKCPDSVVSVYHRVDKNAYIEAFAKVILKGNSYQIQFDDGSNLLRKEITFIAPVMVPYFQLRIVDPWGVQVNMLNNDWSLALEVTEVVNSKTYAELSKTFNRS
jgi:hypothetical protein